MATEKDQTRKTKGGELYWQKGKGKRSEANIVRQKPSAKGICASAKKKRKRSIKAVNQQQLNSTHAHSKSLKLKLLRC